MTEQLNNSWVTAATFRFEVNLFFASEALKKYAIEYRTTQPDENTFVLLVDKDDLERAKEIVTSLNLDEEEPTEESERALEQLEEWSTKQYDPGYYTGGNMPGWEIKIYKKYGGIIGLLIALTGIALLYIDLNTPKSNYYKIYPGYIMDAALILLGLAAIRTKLKSK